MMTATGRHLSSVAVIAPFLPYVTVGVGLLVFHSAWVAILSYHFAMLAVGLWQKGLPSVRVFRGRSWWVPVLAVAVGVSAGILLYVFWPWLGVTRNPDSYTVSIGLSARTWPVFMAYFVLTNALVEEFYWRGLLGSTAKHVTLNDILFSGYHLIVLTGKVAGIWLVAAFAVLAIGAWFWRQVNRWNGGLLASVLSHTAADVTVMLVIYWSLVRIHS